MPASPSLLEISTEEWTLSVWNRDVSSARARLSATISERGGLPPAGRVRFNPGVNAVFRPGAASSSASMNGSLASLDFPEPFLFENRPYEFDFVFTGTPPDDARISHRLRFVEDSFRFTGKSLRGTINPGNDIGWLKLSLEI
ncbi:MAG: hypothetical protein HQL31_14405, partial [Planctomycetes bacterium]|nr:hypothetical protein [Planctomycetota bacterium]